MRNRFWQALIIVGIVAIGGVTLLTLRSNLFGTIPRSPTPLATLIATPDSPSPGPSSATPTPTADPAIGLGTPTPSPTPVATATPRPEGTRPPAPVAEPEGEKADLPDLEAEAEPTAGADPETASPDPAKGLGTPTPTPEPSPTPVATMMPTFTATPVPPPPATSTPAPTIVPPTPSPTSTSTPSATKTPTSAPSATATASPTASRSPTPSPTAAGPYSFRVLPSGDFQVFRDAVPQIVGSPPAGGIKVYLDGQEYHTPAGGQLSSGALLLVSRQYWVGENTNVTVFGGSAGLAITQTMVYSDGANYFTLRWDISSPARADARFFYAFDSSLDGNDLGDPYREPQTGKVGVWNPGFHNRFMGLQPVSPSPSAYTVGTVRGPNGWNAVEASALKSFVGSGTDNYLVALEWDTRLRSDTLWTIEARLTFALGG